MLGVLVLSVIVIILLTNFQNKSKHHVYPVINNKHIITQYVRIVGNNLHITNILLLGSEIIDLNVNTNKYMISRPGKSYEIDLKKKYIIQEIYILARDYAIGSSFTIYLYNNNSVWQYSGILQKETHINIACPETNTVKEIFETLPFERDHNTIAKNDEYLSTKLYAPEQTNYY